MLFIYLHGHQSVEPAGFIPHQQACIQSEPPLESPPLNLLSTPACSVQSKSKACSSALHRPALPGPCLAAVSNLERSRCSRVTTAHRLIGSLMSAGFQVQGRDCCCCVLQRFTALSSTPSLLSAGEWRVEGGGWMVEDGGWRVLCVTLLLAYSSQCHRAHTCTCFHLAF